MPTKKSSDEVGKDLDDMTPSQAARAMNAVVTLVAELEKSVAEAREKVDALAGVAEARAQQSVIPGDWTTRIEQLSAQVKEIGNKAAAAMPGKEEKPE